jgi:CDP-diacylglycerol--glycerol-3-phosphate 3-phosphatidyltransferase
MNTATKFTVARIVLIPLVMAVFLINAIPYNNIIACVLYSLVALTDFVDGYIARKYNQVSDLGKFLDPIADKILIVVMLFLIVGKQILPDPWGAIVCSVVISREFIISGFRIIASEKGVVISADFWGKIKTFLIDFGVGMLILNIKMFTISGAVLLYLGAIISVYSCINYIVKNRQVFKQTQKNEEEENC